MKTALHILTLALSLLGPAVHAQSSLTPAMERDFDVCPDRPLQPDWVSNLDQREANKARLIQQIYRARSMQRIVEAEKCTCETRFPSWEAAETIFFDRHAADDRNELRSTISDYRRTANSFRQVAKPICEAVDNW